MKLECYDSKLIKDTLLTVCRIIEDVIVLECDTNGVRCRALDKSHITFVDLEINYNFFDEYTCEEVDRVCVDGSELISVLKRCRSNDKIILESTSDAFTIIFEDESVRKFTLPLIDSEYEAPAPPIIEHPVNLTIPVSILEMFLDDITLYNDNIRFTVTEDYLFGESNGDFGEVESKYLHGEQVNKSVRSSFSIKMIKDMLTAKTVSKNITLGLDDDKPLSLKFNSPDKDLTLSFLLAPRLEMEE